jgi:hypothetical protein
MTIGAWVRSTCICVMAVGSAGPAAAQKVEAVGSRAQGMGGAFVAVANDSSATWWNPAGLADGPFLDMALARSTTELPGDREDRASWFALGTPPFGFSYYRLQITNIRPSNPTVGAAVSRQQRGDEVAGGRLSASQLGVTLLHTLVPGIHAGATVKWVRGSVDERDTENSADVDVGLLTVTGPFRLGVTGRNLRETEFAEGAFALRRQIRVGAAFSAAQLPGPPLTVAVDADIRRYETVLGDRRVIAVGAEHWLLARRIGVRGGARFNTVGEEERAATAGASVALRSGLYVDGFIVRGGLADDDGWGVAARVSF